MYVNIFQVCHQLFERGKENHIERVVLCRFESILATSTFNRRLLFQIKNLRPPLQSVGEQSNRSPKARRDGIKRIGRQKKHHKMGRKKITITRISDERNRQVCNLFKLIFSNQPIELQAKTQRERKIKLKTLKNSVMSLNFLTKEKLEMSVFSGFQGA